MARKKKKPPAVTTDQQRLELTRFATEIGGLAHSMHHFIDQEPVGIQDLLWRAKEIRNLVERALEVLSQIISPG